MEHAEKEYVSRNLPRLIQVTNCNTKIILDLQSHSLLNGSEVENLTSNYENSFKKCYKLYNILQTRIGSYKILIKALEDDDQTEACQILKKLYYKPSYQMRMALNNSSSKLIEKPLNINVPCAGSELIIGNKECSYSTVRDIMLKSSLIEQEKLATNWTTLAALLQLSTGEIDLIKSNLYQGMTTYAQVYLNVLRHWRNQTGHGANLTNLLAALYQCGLSHVAVNLQEAFRI